MSSVLSYGLGRSLSLEPQELIAQFGGPDRSEQISTQKVVHALTEPIDFPRLSEAVVPGDHVVLALERAVPQAAEIVAAVVETLASSDVEPAEISVLRTQEDAESGQEDPRRLLPDELRDKVRLITHDPHRRNELRYLAAAGRVGAPIYLHHALIDADLVVPIRCARCPTAMQQRIGWDGLYPTFSDAETQRRFRIAALGTNGKAPDPKAELDNEAADWLLGIQFALHGVPGAAGEMCKIFAGAAPQVRELATQAAKEIWQREVPYRADVVAISIDGGSAEQTWSNMGRALEVAAGLVVDGGAIAVCCQLSQPPGQGVEQMVSADEPERVLKRWRRDPPEDAAVAMQLSFAREQARVFLLSDLSEEVVESLGMAYVAEASEFERLVKRNKTCTIVADAQTALVTTES